MRYFFLILFCLTINLAYAQKSLLNIYDWAGVIPDDVIEQFEQENNIKVNFSNYDSNEVMYAKLRTSAAPSYDIIEPSSDYIDRMQHEGRLEPLDKTKITNLRNLNPALLNKAYDPNNRYSIPFIWGVTGIFVNTHYFAAKSISSWSDLWDKKYQNQLLMLNDLREAFSIALKTLGYSINDRDPEHIKQAYLKLKTLLPNIKLFNSDAIISILIDEDVTIGSIWNGDAYKASIENPNITFIYPKEGFIIWVDNLAIPKDAPHKENAHKFLNFVLRADIAAKIALYNNYSTANLAALKLLPASIRNNTTVYPPADILRRGEFETNLGDETAALYEKYWELLKMGG